MKIPLTFNLTLAEPSFSLFLKFTSITTGLKHEKYGNLSEFFIQFPRLVFEDCLQMTQILAKSSSTLEPL